MAEEVIFPSLSTAGFITDRNIIIKKLLYMFVDSDENQSNYYEIKSYKYIVNENEDGYATANAIKLALSVLYNHFYDSVTIDVTYEFIASNSIWVYSISISAIYNTTTYTLKKDIANNILIGE